MSMQVLRPYLQIRFAHLLLKEKSIQMCTRYFNSHACITCHLVFIVPQSNRVNLHIFPSGFLSIYQCKL